MEVKKHFKLYKGGKQWLVAAVATVAVTAGLVLGQQTVNADTVTAATTTEVTATKANDATAKTTDSSNTQPTAGEQQTVNQTTTTKTTTTNQKDSNNNQETGTTSSNVAENDGNNSAKNTDTIKSSTQEQSAAAQTNNAKDGWKKGQDGQMTYYQDGQKLTGRNYVELPTIPGTNVSGAKNWYLVSRVGPVLTTTSIQQPTCGLITTIGNLNGVTGTSLVKTAGS